ncbi:unnamed protein product [Adineta steineri]|uniref:Uncharacterized protein n=1 Tax=Adineta steineri TaxID=433720 RepID=A0A813USC3_9BILA|nr:unnamed protein product [Adineta steineri]
MAAKQMHVIEIRPPAGPISQRNLHQKTEVASDSTPVIPKIARERTLVLTSIWLPTNDARRNQLAASVMISGCFFGDDHVRLVNGDITTISELRSGMKVYSMNNRNELMEDEVIMILHRDPDETDLFCVIETSDPRYKLSVTCDHYVGVSDGSKTHYLISDHVKSTEHFVYVHDDLNHQLELVQVTNVTRQYKTGLYDLATNEGTLVVNNIVASCYSNVTTITIAHNVLGKYYIYFVIHIIIL